VRDDKGMGGWWFGEGAQAVAAGLFVLLFYNLICDETVFFCAFLLLRSYICARF